MDIVKNSSSMICSQHNEQHRLICFGCSKLMCSRCIRLSENNNISNNNNNNNNNNHNNNNNDQFSTFINKRLDSIWKSLRSSTTKYNKLTSIEKIYNYNHNNDDNYEMQCNNQESDIEQSTDTADSYSLASIVDSISNNSSILSFIDDNRTTIFNQHNNIIFNLKELLKQHDNDTTSLLLDTIQKYSNRFNTYTTNTTNNDADLQNNDQYQLNVTKLTFDKLKLIIQQSIKISKLPSNIDSTKSSKINNYIFTTHNSNGATPINTTNNSIEHIHLDKSVYNTYSSVVTVGEYILWFPV
ncbi:hypothetical protein PPL_11406 [Heterostelium album PN500]|uniref:B box-type domain-containing protein n=1 Tax=Heterostelium pallidum (strain ATCC 26659 / Pp 5 / PN500) TaxID=670386 RepID=D3BTB3_HETP5|nr:hypothetical protein PPL_11406 [Heterostelium album PN500]EFA75330.1 hypothetical protein PPL_11406 [Heterostelium album PN500]|eukprot:XP_020427464.1 hypothetical protein PPL_11406 [Heterostelium album PN500]